MPAKQKKIIIHVYTWLLTIIASLYRHVFEASNKKRRGKSPLQIVLLISRPQDVDLLISLHEKAKYRENIRVSFWILKKIDIRFPGVLPLLKEKEVDVDQFIGFAGLMKLLSKLIQTDAFLSTVESTADRFKLPYILTKMANAAGLSTYTMQHGFENIGLSYCDETHGPDIKFASKTIFTWGPKKELPAWVGKDTLDKSVAVGYSNQPVFPNATPPTSKTGKRPIIGVFDNLHWLRYDEKYCSTFLKHLKDISEQRKEFRFILKSHPVSVRKRSKELDAILHNMVNVDVADLLEEEELTTSWLLSHAVGVITTPSTIALDGALANVPIAVCRYGLDLTYYSPLCLLDLLEDWNKFLNCLTKESETGNLKLNGQKFTNRVLVSGSPANNILNLISLEKEPPAHPPQKVLINSR